ncbi:MAG: S8 family serine peptidase, partial [Cyanobacteria bacterium J06632_22]
MLQRLLPWVMLATSSVLGLGAIPMAALAEPDPDESGLFYNFYSQQIPLVERTDQIAVEFETGTRFSSRTGEPAYRQLERDLNTADQFTEGSGPRGATGTPAATVKPLGDRYALVELPATATLDDQWLARLDRAYVRATLPVLNRADSEAAETIIVTSEIVVSFEPGTSDTAARRLLRQYNLDVIRPLQFTEGRYLVRANNVSGTAVLAVSNQLGQVSGILSATPNFIQSIPYDVAPLDLLNTDPLAASRPTALPAEDHTLFPNSFLTLQWHLNSRQQRPRPYSRTDIRATEAWEQNQGETAVVAVIDSLIQWDHPDLVDQVYTVPADSETLLPGETHGWDFSNTDLTCAEDNSENCALGDPDTRISETELDYLRPHFQKSFTLSDEAILAEYRHLGDWIARARPNLTQRQQADFLRYIIRVNISGEFHGTWSAGVIAANPAERQGIVGVAPAAQFLPVRVFGLNGEITSAALIEAIGYAAARDVDVINMSLGGLLPDQELSDQVFDVLDENPDLVIVASAGNADLDGVSFPAALPGVLSVGATNMIGNRTYYSSYGAGLDVVAPGGETNQQAAGGILTAGGTWVDGFWEGIDRPQSAWSFALDPLGQYVR